MNRTTKTITALSLVGAIAVAAATPSFARNGRIAAGVIGFAAGTMLGAAAASANNGYYGGYAGDAYAYEPGYAYAPGYSYGPGYGYYGGTDRTVSPYSQAVKQRHDPYGIRGCATEGAYRPDYSLC
jgi:hypothetical protein